MNEPTTLDEYFALYPEEEDGYYDDMAFLANYGESAELPEDWTC